MGGGGYIPRWKVRAWRDKQRALKENTMKLWLVGGVVRDHLMKNRTHTDLDFAVEAPSFAAMKDRLLTMGLVLWQERPEFVTLRGRLPGNVLGNFGGVLKRSHDGTVAADFTLCRAETQYSDGRHPDTVMPTTLHVDLARRDFTVNAVAVGEFGEWVDPFNGRRDAEYGVLKTVGDAKDRFDEDPLRMLRALRFHVKFNMMLDNGLRYALEQEAVVKKLGTLPHERVREELGKAFQHDWFATAQALTTDFFVVGQTVSDMFPNLWLKATTEGK